MENIVVGKFLIEPEWDSMSDISVSYGDVFHGLHVKFRKRELCFVEYLSRYEFRAPLKLKVSEHELLRALIENWGNRSNKDEALAAIGAATKGREEEYELLFSHIVMICEKKVRRQGRPRFLRWLP
ncbi:MAG: hypothetical protein HYU04_02020 [Candidatus Wildermuthbacteria bacterium]|nr:hypothetical protein [Candidatus Wildermuthbacteria bacterium]